MRRTGLDIVLSALVIGAVAPAAARAEAQAYEALGTAPVSSGGTVRARAEALESALRRAVEGAVTQTAPEARGRLYLVSARAREFVTTYRVLEEGEAGGQFQLRVAAQVDLPRLLRELQAAPALPRPAPGGRRAAVLLCAEEADAAPLLPPLREAVAARAEVAPPAACPPPGEAPAAAALQGLSIFVRAPVDLGRTARVRGTMPVVYGATARVQLGLVTPGRPGAARPLSPAPSELGSGRVEESAEATEFGATPAEALAAAGRAAAERAVQKVLPQLGALLTAPAGEGVVIAIEGLEGYGQYQQLLRTLAAMPGVSGAEPRRFGRTGEEAQAEVLLRTAAAAEPLGAAIGRTPLAGMRLQVMPRDARSLRVLVVKEGALPQPPAPAPPAPDEAAP